MTWTKIAQVLHDCPVPKRREVKKLGLPVGSVWCCDTCSQEWEYGDEWGDGFIDKMYRIMPYRLIDSKVKL
jgi:ribosomal protein L37AE/L43A